jgi:hypothetical protein
MEPVTREAPLQARTASIALRMSSVLPGQPDVHATVDQGVGPKVLVQI